MNDTTKADVKDGGAPLAAFWVENGIVLGVERKEFQPRDGGEPTVFHEALVAVGLETYTATVDKDAVATVRPMTQYRRMRVAVKGVARQGGGHAVRLRIMEVEA